MRYLALAVCAAFAACDPSDDGGILQVEGTAAVEGLVFVDANASLSPDASDTPAAGLRVALLLANTADTVAYANTAADGSFLFLDVPVGTYEVVVAGAALADSMSVVYRDPPGRAVVDIGPDDVTTLALGVDDTALVRLGISYPTYSVEQARELPVGRRIFVRAVAIAPTGSVGDTSLYLQGESAAIRATRVTGQALTAGDSVLVLGTTAVRQGQPTLNGALAIVEEGGIGLDTIPVTANQARTAGGGLLDAQLVRAPQLLVVDTARAGGLFVITTADPSGTVQVALPVVGSFDLGAFGPGEELDVTGVLIPRAGSTGEWRIHPREPADIVER